MSFFLEEKAVKPSFSTRLWLLVALVLCLIVGVSTCSTSPPNQNFSKEELSDTCRGFVGANPPAPEAKAKPSSELEKQAREFAGSNGIDVTAQNGKFHFKLKAGKEIALFTTDASAAGLKDAEKELAKLVSKKKTELESTFGVSFSADGEVVDQQWLKNAKGEWEQGADVKARLPRLNELYGIAAALYRAQPSHKAKGSPTAAIKFYFLTDDLTKGERPLATYRSNRNGAPAIHFYPNSTNGRPVLEIDAQFDPTRSMGHAYGSIEALTLHEISHNHQHVIDWWTVVEKDVADELGFVSTGEGWAVKARTKDKSGNHHLYRKNDKTDKWMRCDPAGKEIAGQPELTGAEMRKEALNRPMTYYFPSPSETYAEGVMVLRLGGVYRASLLAENPALYAVAKRLDQREIDQIYGKDTYLEWESALDQQGRPVWYQVQKERSSYIRGSDGYLVKNTDASRQAVAQYEQKVSDDAARKKLSGTPKGGK